MTPDYRLIWIILVLVAGVFLWAVLHVAMNPYTKEDGTHDVRWKEAAEEVLEGWFGKA
jgi:hypothetical protein